MEPLIKKRRFRVKNALGRKQAETIDVGLSALQGMKRVEVQPPDHVLVEYDLMKINLREIDNNLLHLGHPIAKGLLRRMWKGWIGFTEENEYDNQRSPTMPCCAHPQVVEDNECKICGARATKRHANS